MARDFLDLDRFYAVAGLGICLRVALADGVHVLHALGDLAEDRVPVIEPGRRYVGDEENWEPPVFGPAFAIERTPGLSCLRSGWNSSRMR